MSLKKQLILIFGTLAFILLVIVGVTFWTFMQWRTTSKELQVHYVRNLLLEQIRADMYQAFKEVPDAVTGDDPNSREEFIAFLKPAENDFKTWAELPNTPSEVAELQSVRMAFDSLVVAANYAFDLVKAGRKPEAFLFMENNLEDKNFAHFQQVTDAVAASDRKKSLLVNQKMQQAQGNAQIVLLVATLGAVALILLLSAYISSDLFKPLRDIEAALENASTGNLGARLDHERNDEIGKINAAFNHLIEALVGRENLFHKEKPSILSLNKVDPENLSASNKLAIHSLISQLQDKITYMEKRPNALNDPLEINKLLNELKQLSKAAERIAGFGFPLELKLSRTDISQLLYEVLLHFKSDLIKRSVSLEFDIAPEVTFALVDKLKLSQAIQILIQNALDSLPEKGGKIGIRARLEKDNTSLFIEIADNGRSRNETEIEKRTTEDSKKTNLNALGINLAREIVEQHEGQLKEIYNPENGNYVRIEIPLIIPPLQ